ncbi:MAG: sensor histidine kinase [Patescibacteria group bacterium]
MKLHFRNSVKVLRENFQFMYGILLFILIPAALVVNTLLQTNRTNDIIDIELQRKASLAASVFSQEVPTVLDDPQALQQRVSDLAARNDEIRSLDVLIPDGDGFRIVASLDQSRVNTPSTYLYNTIAWQTEEPIAYTTTSAARSTEDPTQLGSERFWVVVRTVTDMSGEKIAVVTMKVSSRVVDELVQQNLNRSLVILVISIVIIILLLANNTRLYRNTLLLKKLKELDEMKDEFISMASHELRAPITGIRGYLQMLLDGSFGVIPDEARKKLLMVRAEGERLHDLVEDLLEVSRIEQGRVSLHITAVNVEVLLTQVIQTFQHQADEKGLSLVKAIQPHIPPVQADASRLQQILVNLLSNAIKYTMHGKVTVAVDEIRDKNSMVRIKISDTGIGIAAKDRDKLFEKFYRVRSSQTDKITGTGLGLWITRELVRIMGGEIFLDSIEHVGTHVTILLPIHQSSDKKL